MFYHFIYFIYQKEVFYMHDIIEHYGKVIIALAGVLAALLLTAAVVTTISNKTKTAVSGIEYETQIRNAFNTP